MAPPGDGSRGRSRNTAGIESPDACPAMHIINHSALPRSGSDGCQRQTVAGAAVGAAPFEVELLCLEAGARWSTAAQRHVRVLLPQAEPWMAYLIQFG